MNVQLPPGANVVPAQFWDPPKFVGSIGAPPAKFGVRGTAEMLVIVTGSAADAPSGTLPKARLDGVAEKFCAWTAAGETTMRSATVAATRWIHLRPIEDRPSDFEIDRSTRASRSLPEKSIVRNDKVWLHRESRSRVAKSPFVSKAQRELELPQLRRRHAPGRIEPRPGSGSFE